MPLSTVHHARSPLAFLRPDPQDWIRERWLHYCHVATVQASDPERVFLLTNHIDEQDWSGRPEVVWRAAGATPRSTSVGDVIREDESGRAWLVTRDGMDPIPSAFRRNTL
jgi:hypothetical protein